MPGFQAVQDYINYDVRTHHTNMDTAERIDPRRAEAGGHGDGVGAVPGGDARGETTKVKFPVASCQFKVGIAVAVLLTATVLAQSAKVFKARLSTVPIDVAMQSEIAGRGTVTATLDGNTLNISGTFQELKSAATVARLHRGYRGVRGPAFADLKVSNGTSGTISGAVALTPSQVSELGKSLFYVQVHSEKAPDGNLWGWLLPAEETRK